MAYAIYRGGKKIQRISGDPRADPRQRQRIVWDDTEAGVRSWIKEWGTKKQRETFLKPRKRVRRQPRKETFFDFL